MPGPAVARAEARGVPGHRDCQGAARPEHTPDLAESGRVVLDVLEHLAEHGGVEGRVLERQVREIGGEHALPEPFSQHLDGLWRDVGARHVEPPLEQAPGHRPLAGARVEHTRAGVRGEEQVEQQALAELVPRPDEVRRGSPPVRAHATRRSSKRRHRAPSVASLARSS